MPAPAAAQRVEALRAAGHDVTFHRVDVTDEAALRAAIESVRAEHGAIRGVVHAAGTLDDAYLLHKSWEEFTEVVRPKALGARLLDRLTAEDPLDFFVCFSSIAAAFGNAGQSDYAYANAHLDAFAERRRAQVADGSRFGRTLSLGWPLWLAGGMLQDEDAVRALRQRTGLSPMPTDAALAAFDQALRHDGGALLVGHGDLARVAATLEPAPVRRSRAAGGAEQTEPSGTDLAAWAATFLKQLLAERTKLDAGEIDPRVPFDRYGIDSLVITQLNAELEKHFDDLPKTLFFEYATLEELAEYFVAEYAGRLGELAAAFNGPAGKSAPPASTSADHAESAPALTARTTEPHRPGPADADDAVAVIGLAGRYPMADDLDEFWDNLAEGRDCVTEIPADRWDHGRYFDPDPSAAGRAFSKWGGFLRDVDRFDPLFFGISPREAELMDPQERLFLQNAWHVFEDAGYRGDELSGRPVGVFVGVMYGEYQLYGAADAERGGIRVTGSSFASIANRVSYTLGLNGPSIALDTMCSSSLTAIHLACESLRGGESEMAVAGGVNLSLHPYKYVFLSQGRFVSADGKCRAFGAGGTGYVPGEGVGAVLLKPLAAAERDGDRVYGVIRGHAVNHGGKTNGYTVPSPHAQADSVRRALRGAGLEPADIGYVEAHGTGTSLGDPIEIAGLAKAFGATKADGRRWPIGSVKSNIGHLESAAGIAGLTKVLLQFKHRRLAPSLHADELNPNIDFGRSPFLVQREAADWPAPAGEHGPAPRRAGVSSFGAGGTNAHLVIEEYHRGPERPERPVAAQRFPRTLVFPLSARDPERLAVYAGRLADFAEREHVRAEDLAHTLQHGRTTMAERLAVVADDGAALVRALRAFQQGAPCPGLVTGASPGPEQPTAHDPAHSVARALDTARGAADWSGIAPAGPKPRRVPAPAYPFDREHHRVPAADRSTAGAPARLHPLLDANESTLDEIRFRRTFRADDPLVRDHVIEGRTLLAGAVCLEMARAAARLAGLDDALGLRDVLWGRPVVIEDGQNVDVHVADPHGRRTGAHGRRTGLHRLDGTGTGNRAHRPRARHGVREPHRSRRGPHRPRRPSRQLPRGQGPRGGQGRLPGRPLRLRPGLRRHRGGQVRRRRRAPHPHAARAGRRLAAAARPARRRTAGLPLGGFAVAAGEREPRGPLPPRRAGDPDAAAAAAQVPRARRARPAARSRRPGAVRLAHPRRLGGRTGPHRQLRRPHLAQQDAPFFYEQVWQDQALVAGAAPRPDAVLVLGDDDEVARGLAGTSGGRRVIDVRARRGSPGPGPTGSPSIPRGPATSSGSSRTWHTSGRRSLDVVHLWGLSAEPVAYGREGDSAAHRPRSTAPSRADCTPCAPSPSPWTPSASPAGCAAPTYSPTRNRGNAPTRRPWRASRSPSPGCCRASNCSPWPAPAGRSCRPCWTPSLRRAAVPPGRRSATRRRAARSASCAGPTRRTPKPPSR